MITCTQDVPCGLSCAGMISGAIPCLVPTSGRKPAVPYLCGIVLQQPSSQPAVVALAVCFCCKSIPPGRRLTIRVLFCLVDIIVWVLALLAQTRCLRSTTSSGLSNSGLQSNRSRRAGGNSELGYNENWPSFTHRIESPHKSKDNLFYFRECLDFHFMNKPVCLHVLNSTHIRTRWELERSQNKDPCVT